MFVRLYNFVMLESSFREKLDSIVKDFCVGDSDVAALI